MNIEKWPPARFIVGCQNVNNETTYMRLTVHESWRRRGQDIWRLSVIMSNNDTNLYWVIISNNETNFMRFSINDKFRIPGRKGNVQESNHGSFKSLWICLKY